MVKLGFIGAGNMAEALARGLLAAGLFKPAEMLAADVEPQRRRRFSTALKIATTTDNLEVARNAAAILIAVKPQQIDQAIGALCVPNENTGPAAGAAVADRSWGAKLFISIAAGVTLERLERNLGGRARVIRVMPNAPAMVGEGMAALVGGSRARREDLAFALRIFRAVGDAVALNDEALLDVVTALSGSGPAYVYLFAKALGQAAASAGLSPGLAARMALQTIRGAAKTMRMSRRTPDELIRIVASPGGTTEAALARLAEGGFERLVGDAVRAATARSRELARG